MRPGHFRAGRRRTSIPPSAGDPMSARLYPLFADLRGRAVLVVGGGAVAQRKAAALLEAGAQVRIGAPALTPELQRQVDAGAIEHLPGTFDPAWLDSVWLAIAATDDAG